MDRFLLSGIDGATLRSLVNKALYRFNVKNYGALGDGVIDVNGDLSSGTDDTAAIQNCILDAWQNGCSEVFFPNGVYRISGPLVTSYNGQNPNCQIYIPINSNSETSRTIKFIGEAGPGTLTSVITTLLPPITGVILYSDITGTGTNPAVIGGKNNTPTFGVYYINCDVDFENIQIRVKGNASSGGPTMCGINGEHYSNMGFTRTRVDISCAPQTSVQPTNPVFGIKTFISGGNSRVQLNDTLVTGFKNGYIFGELAGGQLVQAYGCENAFVFDHGAHACSFQHMIASGCINAVISGRDAGLAVSSPNIAALRITTLSWEHGTYGGKWYAPINTVKDSQNELYGSVFYACVEGQYNPSVFVKSGGTNLVTAPI